MMMMAMKIAVTEVGMKVVVGHTHTWSAAEGRGFLTPAFALLLLTLRVTGGSERLAVGGLTTRAVLGRAGATFLAATGAAGAAPVGVVVESQCRCKL